MTLQTLEREFVYPNFGLTNNSTIGFGQSSTIDASGEYVCFIFRAKQSMTISHVALRCLAVSGSPTADIRIETVDATTGLPSGTLWATNTNVVTATLTTTMDVHALTASATIAFGEYVAVKIAYNSGTSFTVANFTGSFVGTSVLPYQVVNTGTPTKTGMTHISLSLALGSSSSAFYKVAGLIPIVVASGGAATSISTATQDAIGIRFKIPHKARICGHIHSNAATSTGAYTYGVYNDSNTELDSSSTAAADTDMTQGNGNGGHQMMYLDNPVILSPDTWYRYLLWPTSSTAFVVHVFGALNADLKAIQPGGTNWHYVKKAVGGAWTDSLTTDSLLINLMFDQLDDAVGSGGGTYFSVGG